MLFSNDFEKFPIGGREAVDKAIDVGPDPDTVILCGWQEAES
jgi:hypothetical protein